MQQQKPSETWICRHRRVPTSIRRLCPPLIVLVCIRVDDVPDEAVVVAAVRCSCVHRDADEVVLITLCGLSFFPKT